MPGFYGYLRLLCGFRRDAGSGILLNFFMLASSIAPEL
jgi:hypothetical protein